MTATVSQREVRKRGLRTEVQLAFATPVGRLLIASSVVMSIVFCSANLAVLDDLNAAGTTQLALHAATVPVLMFALLAGTYSASSDRRYGFLEQRLLSNGGRSQWLNSKAVVQGFVGALYGALGVFTAIITSFVAFSLGDASFDATSPDTIKALIGVLIAAPLLSVLGVFIGSLIPNTPIAVAGILVWSLVIEPPIILGLPSIGKWLPIAGALSLTNTPNPDLASQLWGGISLAAFTIVAFLFVNGRLQNIDV